MKVVALMENTSQRADLQAEHGLSLYLETNGHRVLFDMGQSSGFVSNATRLGVDLSAVDLAILSHGHYDHGGGLLAFLAENPTAPVYASRYVFEPHLSGERQIGLSPTLQNQPQLRLTEDVTQLAEGLTLYSCNHQPYAYPLDTAGMGTVRDGVRIAEDFRHEQYLLVEENGKRVLISGCSHKGVLNLLDWFRPDYLVGGFHLKGKSVATDAEELDAIAQALKKHHTMYYTCHCTGQEPYQYLKQTLKQQLHYLSTGQDICL